jgi:xanthine dehydrogenase YagS FAD-binding subunit
MRPFSYQRIETPDAVLRDAPLAAGDSFIAGGTTLLDLMKLDVMRPQRVVDINPLLGTRAFGGIEVTDTGLRLGALARMSAAAEHPAVRENYPVIAEALELAASQQLRNMATLGGNVLQRTRCPYFRDTSWTACNKRTPGSGCAARNGFNRMHAVLGTSQHCIATYPGDFAQALIALDAEVHVLGPKGARTLPFSALHTRPGDRPDVETTLAPDELIQAFVVPAGPWTRRSTYLKVRDRESYEFALASAAVALHLEGEAVREARIALGGVATVPWRAREAEGRLVGRVLDEPAASEAADAAFAAAEVREHNAYKVPLGKATLVRALLQAKAMED